MVGAQHVQIFAHGITKRPTSLQDGVHVSHFALNELKLSNALTKLFAIVDIRNNVVHDRLHDAQRTGRQHSAFVIQPTHEHLGAHVEAAQNIFCGHFHILKNQLTRVAAAHAQLIELLRNGKALHVFLDQESRHTACAHFGFGFGIHHQRIGVWPVGNPHLVTIQQVIAAFVFGFQFHADDV